VRRQQGILTFLPLSMRQLFRNKHRFKSTYQDATILLTRGLGRLCAKDSAPGVIPPGATKPAAAALKSFRGADNAAGVANGC
jgi:hypothetical protein